MPNADLITRTFKFPQALYAQLVAMAEREHRSVNQQLQYLVERAIHEHDKK